MKLSDLLKVEGRSSSMHSFNRSSYYSTINSSLLNGWDQQNNYPLSILTSNHSELKTLNPNHSTHDITNEIVSSKHTKHTKNSSVVYTHSGYDALQKYRNTQRRDLLITPNYKKDELHEVVKIEKPFYVTKVEEIERYWKAKEIMLQRQKSQLEFDIKLQQQLANKKPVILKVEPLQQITDIEMEIQQLEQQLKQKNDIVNDLKQESEELDVKYETTYNDDTQYLHFEKQLKNIQQSFKDLNRRFHETEEQIMMKQNEIESKKKQIERKQSVILPIRTDCKLRSSFKRSSINSGTMSPTRVTFSQKSQPSEEFIKFRR